MEIVEAGHVYDLANNQEGIQTVTFMSKFSEQTHDGTTDEEVLAMMIDRLKHLNGLLSSRETSLAITKLKEVVNSINKYPNSKP